MKETKIYTMKPDKFETHVMAKVAVQSELNTIENALVSSIKELEDKLEFIKSRQWKYKIGDHICIKGSAYMWEIVQLLDSDKDHLYLAQKVDPYNVFTKNGYIFNADIVTISHKEANESDLITTASDYAAHILQTYINSRQSNYLN